MIPLFVGYQLRRDERFIQSILDHRDRVREVYFSWPGIANGRNTLPLLSEFTEWEALERQRTELFELHRAGLRMNLLLNGNCYGAESLSRSLYTRIGDLVDWLGGNLGLSSVTTASPVIARFLRQNFPEIEIRASVNMEIGTSEGVEYLCELMDGFYVKREYNRSLEAVRQFSESCRRMGKKVYLLANSGCLNYCSARTFHDNLVSHEQELVKRDNAYAFDGLCRQFMADEGHRRRWIQLTNWIRPEDIRRYEGLVDGVKLATRVSRTPELIVRAYAEGRFYGNLPALLEPDLSALFLPGALNAGRIPEGFFEELSGCDRRCAQCGYCEAVYARVREDMPEDATIWGGEESIC